MNTSTSQKGDNVILSIFNEMVAVGEQQESLLLRELETDISVSRCVEIMSYLEQNISLVRIAFMNLPVEEKCK